MKKLLLMPLLFFVSLLLIGTTQVQAQVGQNVVLSCLNVTTTTPKTETINGKTYPHMVSLTNKEQGIFSPNQPVYVVRSLPRVFCLPDNKDPSCQRDEQERYTTCTQEKVGAELCNMNCTVLGSVNHVCSPNNAGPGITNCCMPLYTKQGPYFECANDANEQLVCPQSIMADPGQDNGIHPAENGHIETGYASNFHTLSLDKSSLLADANGNITITKANSYTSAALDHSFYGMQILSDSDINSNEAFKNSLKLAVFAEIQTIEPSATNCTTVFWDPFGKVIDALRLEPIGNANVLLRNQTASGAIINTTLVDNPAFINPQLTDMGGNFNFAVLPGTYFLTPTHNLFSYPLEATTLSTALNTLANIDPNQEYFKRDQIYNNPNEPIIEQAGAAERRDIIMLPKDSNYQGTAPQILYAENLRDGTSQLVRGRVSHPKSIVKAYLGSTAVAQTEAKLDGSFSLSLPQETLTGNNGNFQLVAEKTALTAFRQPHKLKSIFARFVSNVWAQENTNSRPYKLSLVPLRMTGFVFDTNLQVKPNSIVQISVPSLGGITYAQAKADENGFVNIENTNLPPFDFVLTVRDENQPTNSYQLTVEDFKKSNTVYLAETRGSLYNDQVAMDKPSELVIEKIKAETPRRVALSSLTFNKTPTIVPANAPTTTQKAGANSALVFVFVFFLAIIVVGGILVINKSRQNKGIYY